MSSLKTQFVIAGFCICALSSAQIPFHDALRLARCVGPAGIFETRQDNYYIDILRLYLPDSLAKLPAYRRDSIENVRKYYRDNNPMLKDYIPVSSAYATAAAVPFSLKTLSPGKGMPLSSAVWVDGLARFLADRFKQEISMAYLEKLRKELSEQTEFRALFPLTAEILLYGNPYEHQVFLMAVRSAFAQDMRHIFRNLGELSRLPSMQQHLNTPGGELFLFSLQSAALFTQEQDILRLLHGLASDIAYPSSLRNLGEAMRLADLLSSSLRDTTGSRWWVGRAEMEAMSAIPHAPAIFLGLLWQENRMKKISFSGKDGKDVPLDSLLVNAHRNMMAFSRGMERWTLLTERIETLVRNKETDAGYKAVAASMNILPEAMELTLNMWGIALPADSAVQSFAVTLASLSRLYTAVNEGDYITAGYTACILLEKTFSEKASAACRYIPFFAGLASARSSEEAEALLSSMALPPGSSRLKREAKLSASVNAWAGWGAGGEYLSYLPSDPIKPALAFYAPVGIALSRGMAGKRNASHTLFFQALDLGAVTAFRLADDSAAALPDATLANVVSPGLYYVHGFGRSPLSWGIGAQMGPALRRLTVSGAGKADGMYVRFGAFLAVDIPLLNLYLER